MNTWNSWEKLSYISLNILRLYFLIKFHFRHERLKPHAYFGTLILINTKVFSRILIQITFLKTHKREEIGVAIFETGPVCLGPWMAHDVFILLSFVCG